MEMVSVMVPGPPSVRAQMTSKMRNEIEAADEDGDRHDRPDRRQHDLEEDAPEARPVELGCFEQGAVDMRQGREQDQEHERRPLPDLADEDGGVDERWG